MLKLRFISGLVLLVVVTAVILAGLEMVAITVWIVWGIGLLEFNHLIARRGIRAHGGLMLLWLAAFVIDRLWPGTNLMVPFVAVLLILTLVWSEVRYRQGTANAMLGFAVTIGGAFYIGWTGSHIIGIRGLEDGTFWLFTVCVATISADTMAYLIGGWIGRTPFVPDISPKKTWEGYLGGMVSAIILTALSTVLWRQLGASAAMSIWHGIAIGALVSIIGPVGDLGISTFKRYAKAKDTSNLIPGHGGILDRVDVFSLAGLMAYYYLTLVVL